MFSILSPDTNIRKQCFILTYLRAQGDSHNGACAAKCSKFDFEKFENLTIPLKGACAPMRGYRVERKLKVNGFTTKNFSIERVAGQGYLSALLYALVSEVLRHRDKIK